MEASTMVTLLCSLAKTTHSKICQPPSVSTFSTMKIKTKSWVTNPQTTAHSHQTVRRATRSQLTWTTSRRTIRRRSHWPTHPPRHSPKTNYCSALIVLKVRSKALTLILTLRRPKLITNPWSLSYSDLLYQQLWMIPRILTSNVRK